ncbi:MAG: TolC family protein [Kofleriaceae bacterium]
MRPFRSLVTATVAFAVAATPTLAAAGPSGESVKLDDLIAVAVQQSAGLAKARADRSIAKAEATAAGADQDWITSAEVGWNKTVVGANADYQPVQLVEDAKVTGTLGVAKKLPTGGSVSAQVGLAQKTQTYDIDANLFTVADGMDIQYVDNGQASAQIKVEQPLVRGFGVAAGGVQRRARAAAEGANVKAQLAAEELIRDLVSSYWELAYAAQELQVRKRSLELANTQFQTTRDAKRAGAVADSALRAVEYQLAVREEALLRAQVEVESRSLELRRVSGLEVSRRDLVLIPGETFEIEDGDESRWNIDDALDAALADNPRLQVLLAEKRAADVDVDLARDAARPQVNVALEGTLFGDGPSTGEALGALGAGGGYMVGANLSFQFEIGGSRRAATEAATLRRTKVVIDAQDLRRIVEVEIVQAVHAVTSARQRVTLAEKSIDVANVTVQAEIANFRAARSSNFDVFQRQDELVESELRKARSIADFHIAVARLEFLTGTLLERYGVEVRSSKRGR